jgi:hypothetical protein
MLRSRKILLDNRISNPYLPKEARNHSGIHSSRVDAVWEPQMRDPLKLRRHNSPLPAAPSVYHFDLLHF